MSRHLELRAFFLGNLSLCGLVALAATGCSERGFRNVEPPNTTQEDPTSPVTELPPGCEGAVVETFDLAYPARQDCPFDVDDNLSRRNEHNQARVEEYRSIRLPEGAQVCSLSLVSRENSVFFDDHLTMTLNDIVLVGGGSGYLFDDLVFVDGLPRYEWPEIAGTPFAERYAPYDCLGGEDSVCQVPRTEETAPFHVEIAPAAMQMLTGEISDADAMRFGVITFGDDDGGDCAHSAVTLEVTLAYLE